MSDNGGARHNRSGGRRSLRSRGCRSCLLSLLCFESVANGFQPDTMMLFGWHDVAMLLMCGRALGCREVAWHRFRKVGRTWGS